MPCQGWLLLSLDLESHDHISLLVFELPSGRINNINNAILPGKAECALANPGVDTFALRALRALISVRFCPGLKARFALQKRQSARKVRV